ncbi:MAG TPA: efflux RND transporter periplasmic adaptor subunit [Candidatus Paceibacterota bacterium]|nr:efflux RND transporter periplasmic adaptor subunit [Candidatus Paceibacterota bacterium]
MISFKTIRAYLVAYKFYVLALGLILIIGIAIWRSDSPDTTETKRGPREVRVARVSDLMLGTSPLSTVAEVRSVSEAKINTEASGRITRIRAELGDFVGAGQIIAEIENSSQRAALIQAEGALEAARASGANAASTLDSAKGTAVTTLLAAYAAANSAIEDAVGQMVDEPETAQPRFIVSTTDQTALATIQDEIKPNSPTRNILRRQEITSQTLSASSNLDAELKTVEQEMRAVRAYLDAVLKALNAAVPREDVTASTISGYISDVTAARTSMTTALSNVILTQTSLQTALTNAEGNGGVSSSQAAIKQAEGLYQAALANVEKTLIRSPIAGSLNNFTLKLGDYVTASQQVAIVSNNNALEAVAYITDADRSRIAIGSTVTIENSIEGTITKIAPALDPVTRRIEVRIGLPESASQTLTNGQSIRIQFARADVPSAAPQRLAIPITALKMETDRSVVFTVSAENKLEAREVQTGPFSGQLIQITEGLTADTEIVADARGLKEGDTITPIR